MMSALASRIEVVGEHLLSVTSSKCTGLQRDGVSDDKLLKVQAMN